MTGLEKIAAEIPKIKAAMNRPIPLSNLEADIMDAASAEGSWINASWVRMWVGRPPGCLHTLAAIDRLVVLGLLEVYTPDIPAGDSRRLEDDVRLTERARAMCAQAGYA